MLLCFTIFAIACTSNIQLKMSQMREFARYKFKQIIQCGKNYNTCHKWKSLSFFNINFTSVLFRELSSSYDVWMTVIHCVLPIETVNSQHLLKYAHYRFWTLSVSLSMWFSDAHHTHPMYKIVCEYVFTKHIFLV